MAAIGRGTRPTAVALLAYSCGNPSSYRLSFLEMHRVASLLCMLLLSLLSSHAIAKGKALRALHAPSKVIYDGLPKEFDTDWVSLEFDAKGSSTANDIAARATVAYDGRGLYVAADVTDDKLVGGGDFVELLLGIPGGSIASFRLYPGVAGDSRAQAKDKAGRKISGAKIVEAPKSRGYTLEAFIPWRAVPRSSTIRIGYRGALYVHDADASKRVDTIIGSADTRSYAGLPPLSTMTELSLGSGLLRERNIRKAPRFNLMANVVGDKLLERVLVYDRFLVVLGPGYRNGEQYYYRDLGTSTIAKLEVKDFTGDGMADLRIDKTVRGSGGTVGVVEVLSYHGGGETPVAVFAQEIRLQLDDGGEISNDISVSGSGSRTKIRIGAGKASGIDKANFVSASSTGASPVLLPWGSVASQIFTLTDGTFELAKETSQAGEAVVSVPPSPEPSGEPAQRPRTTSRGKRRAARGVERAADVERVYALYRKQRKVRGKARFDIRANLTAGKKSERMVVHGRDLVVFGPEFRGGRGFSAITLSHFEKSSDIRSVSARDVTGDGKREIVVKGVIRSPLPEDVGEGQMHRSVMLVYKVKGDVIERVFAAELARRIGSKRIEAKITFSRKAKHKITLKPGRAVGYTKETYPWLQKTEPDGDFEPLILPWGGINKVRLRYDGGKFVR